MGKKEYRSQYKHGLLQEIWKCRLAYLFLLPLFTGLCIFCYYPPVIGIVRSLTKWDGTGSAVFLGVDNYRRLFSDEVFLNSLPTLFKLHIPKLFISIVAPLVMAELIFNLRNSNSQKIYRTMILLPMVAPGVVGTLIWKFIYNPTEGLLTAILRALHIMSEEQIIDWLGEFSTVIPSLIFMGFPWVGGTSVLIYTSGLVSISEDVIEASKLDGCSTFKRVFLIDIPNLTGQIRYFLIFGIIGGLQSFGTQVVLTHGGPGYATMVPGYYMYKQAFSAGNMGYACAIGVIMFMVIATITALTYKLLHPEGIQI